MLKRPSTSPRKRITTFLGGSREAPRIGSNDPGGNRNFTLPRGVCVEVYASTYESPKTGSAWPTRPDDFYVSTPRVPRHLRRVLSYDHTVLLTAHTGCGCGFGFGLPGATEDEILEAFARAPRNLQDKADSSTSELIEWVQTHAPLKLWIRTNTLHDDRPKRVIDTKAESLSDLVRTIRVGDLVRVS